MFKHGHSTRAKSTPTYRAWSGIVDRCTNSKYRDFPRYGGRGITVCDRWLESFENFLADMGVAPSGMSIERENNDGNYEPGNCKWATRTEQANNRSSNQTINYQGRTFTLAQASREFGISQFTLRSRIFNYGYSVEKALTKPIGPNRRRSAS